MGSAILEFPRFERNQRAIRPERVAVHVGARVARKECSAAFRLYFLKMLYASRGVRVKRKRSGWRAGGAFARGVFLVAITAAALALPSIAQVAQAEHPACCSRTKKQRAKAKAAANRFSARADVALGAAPASKGEWGL